MSLVRARFRPMLRVETVVLRRDRLAGRHRQWRAGGAAAGAGRAWTEPANWLFMLAAFVALVALHFVLLAPLANRWTMRPLLSADRDRQRRRGVLHAHLRRDAGSDHDPEHPADRHARGGRAHVLVAGGIGAAVVGVAGGVHLVGAYRTTSVARCHAHSGARRYLARALVVAVLAVLPVNPRPDLADAQSARAALPDHARQLHLRPCGTIGARRARRARAARARGHRRAVDTRGAGGRRSRACSCWWWAKRRAPRTFRCSDTRARPRPSSRSSMSWHSAT